MQSFSKIIAGSLVLLPVYHAPQRRLDWGDFFTLTGVDFRLGMDTEVAWCTSKYFDKEFFYFQLDYFIFVTSQISCKLDNMFL